MRSEDDAYQPQYHEDRRARFGRNKDGVTILWHPCQVCGLVYAPFGVNVSLRNGHFGEWYCAEHLPQEHRPPVTRKRPATPQKSPE